METFFPCVFLRLSCSSHYSHVSLISLFFIVVWSLIERSLHIFQTNKHYICCWSRSPFRGLLYSLSPSISSVFDQNTFSLILYIIPLYLCAISSRFLNTLCCLNVAQPWKSQLILILLAHSLMVTNHVGLKSSWGSYEHHIRLRLTSKLLMSLERLINAACWAEDKPLGLHSVHLLSKVERRENISMLITFVGWILSLIQLKW